MKSPEPMPLAFLQPGESGTVVEIRGLKHRKGAAAKAPARPAHGRQRRDRHLLTSDGTHRLEHRLKSLGLVSGSVVRMIRNSPGGGVVVALGDSRISIGRGVAHKVMVRPSTGGTDG